MDERCIRSVGILVELSEYEVPQFQETAAVTAGPAFRSAAAPVGTQIDMDFRIRSAGTAADFPEIILQPDDAFIGYADDIVPDMIGFIIFRINGDPQLVSGQFQFFGKKFPGPGDDFFLEVIAKREVAEHLEIRLMPGRMADVLDIIRTDALLTRRDPLGRRFLLAREEGLERGHTGTDQKQGRVVMRDEGSARKHHMTAGLEEIKIFFANFVTS